jgi:molybdopterin converting factor small subunit
MPSNVVDASEEHFVLKSPAHFRDLKSVVVGEHPLLLPMFPTMLSLVDGVPATPATELNDGDEVDFIPAVAGG